MRRPPHFKKLRRTKSMKRQMRHRSRLVLADIQNRWRIDRSVDAFAFENGSGSAQDRHFRLRAVKNGYALVSVRQPSYLVEVSWIGRSRQLNEAINLVSVRTCVTD